MFEIFVQEKCISVGMLSAMILSILGRIIIWIIYQNMIKETENMSVTNNKVLKQCKLKYANCYKMGGRISNVPVFVDKFLSRLRLGPFSLQTLYHLSIQLMLLGVVFGGMGACRGIVAGRRLNDLLPFYIVSFLGLYAYFVVAGVTDIREKRRILKISLVDYLENHMSGKLEELERDLVIVAPTKDAREELEETPREPQGEKHSPSRPEHARELEQLLKEFFA